jgi:hypothetical protein
MRLLQNEANNLRTEQLDGVPSAYEYSLVRADWSRSVILKEDVNRLVTEMLKGDAVSLAKLLRLAESESEQAPKIIKAVRSHAGESYYLSITGPLRARRSTIADQLVSTARDRGLGVGVVWAELSGH